jgi:eukaryotic-like serine/threonine-protein kinase
MSDVSAETSAGDSYPQIDAKDTDRQLNQYYSNSFTRYSDFEPLAKGGSAVLQTCRDSNLGRTVVMKILHPHLAQNEYMKARFLREARVTAQLQHPATVPVYEIGHDIEGRLYFTMKMVEGQTLREILDKQSLGDEEASSTYNLDRMLGIIIQVCNALHYAHVHGVVHRDIKPENILIGEFGEVIVLDWGVAKVWSNDEPELHEIEHEVLTDTSQRPGTPLYMSPEQIRGGGEDIDGRTDVYGIGAVLYEILTLKEPHRGENISETFEMILNEETIPPEKRASGRQIPKALSAITMKALRKQPVDRYQSMQDLITALRDFRSRAIQSLTVH